MIRIAFCIAAIAIGTPAFLADEEYDNLNESARTAIIKGDYETAVARCERAIRLNPKAPDAYITRGWAWNNLKKYDKAIEDCTTALSLAPGAADESYAYCNRGHAYQKTKEYGKALKDYNLAITANPKNPLGYNNLAWLLASCPDAKFRDGEKAFEAIKKAREIDPYDSNFLGTAAAVYAECGDFDQAVKFQELAIKGENQSNAEGDDALKKKKERLELYKKKMPCRE